MYAAFKDPSSLIGMYSQSITRTHRTAFVLLIDCSGSMSEDIRFRGELCTKAEAVATITNELIYELIERARRSDIVRNYYDLALVGYGGDDEICSLLGDHTPCFISIDQLAQRDVPIQRRSIAIRRPDGSTTLRSLSSPQWITPRAAGNTPMLEAFRTARDLMHSWASIPAHAESFPPILFNITDGEMTDGSPEELRSVAEEIRAVGTTDGTALLFNIHITADDRSQTLLLPSIDEPLPHDRNIELLYTISSEMPANFNALISDLKGPLSRPPFRAMSYNASAAELLTILDIGTISVKIE